MHEIVIRPRIELGLKGFLTHQVLDRHGRVISSFTQENLITDAGLAGLQDRTIDSLLTYAIIGRKTSVAIADLSTDWWTPVDALVRCDAAPEQTREVTGDSSQSAVNQEIYELDPGHDFIKRTSTRDFWFGSDANYGNEWAFGRDADGVQPPLPSGDLFWEKLAAWGFTDDVRVHTLSEDCGGVPTDYEEYQLSDVNKAPSTLWSNELFRDELGNPITYRFGTTGTGDITIAEDGVLRLIYELFILIPKTISTDIIDVNGTNITCDSRAYRVNAGGWADAGGLAGRLGYWGAVGVQHRVWESNSMPGLTTEQSGAFDFCSAAVQGLTGNLFSEWDITVEPESGNFTGGIGSLTWGTVASAGAFEPFITTFTPQIPKTDIHRIVFSPRLTWARV